MNLAHRTHDEQTNTKKYRKPDGVNVVSDILIYSRLLLLMLMLIMITLAADDDN